MAEDVAGNGVPRLRFTEAAVAKLREVVASNPRPVAGLRLWIAARGPEGFDHGLTLVEDGRPPADHVRVEADGLVVFVDTRDASYMDGVRIHYQYKGPQISGLEFENPNPLWRDPLALRVQELFDRSINPSIAAHGGYVNLLEVKGTVAYVELGGGCQGCGMASVTLKQGIEVAVKEAVPEIAEVVDTTDHASGSNPYYKPSKK